MSFLVTAIMMFTVEALLIATMVTSVCAKPLERLSTVIAVTTAVGFIMTLIGYSASGWLLIVGVVNLAVSIGAALRALHVHVDGFSLAQ